VCLVFFQDGCTVQLARVVQYRCSVVDETHCNLRSLPLIWVERYPLSKVAPENKLFSLKKYKRKEKRESTEREKVWLKKKKKERYV